ncbi:MAG: phosphoesterase [Alkaliphilus sp.]|nr:PHP domain-containing protein [bacterium AH-315-G05]PHS36276.1 MAG: phosphoesterase [Alkaliphilus sp.]
MKLAIDLHIHSGLSPCADISMTPNNIVNMARLKGLDVIAITDHNSTKNLRTTWEIARKTDIIFVPGVELTTKEEVHVVCLFDSLEKAEYFQQVLDKNIVNIKNRVDVFGHQHIYNINDEIVDEYELMLMNATELSLENAIMQVKELNGVLIPAHIDRNSFSILSNLGFISPELEISTVEISNNCNYDELEKKHPYLNKYRKIVNSDAHVLGDILERTSFIEVEKKNAKSVLKKFKKGMSCI